MTFAYDVAAAVLRACGRAALAVGTGKGEKIEEMGNAQAGGNLAQCCCESRTDAAGMQSTVLLAKPPVKEAENLHGVGLVFRTTRDGKMVVSSFVKDSSAYECGLVRDGGG